MVHGGYRVTRANPARAPGGGVVWDYVSTSDDLSGHQWRQLVVSVYLPTMLSFLGFGAVTPLIALAAHDLGATTPQAAFVVALIGIGGLVGALPAGILAERFGERFALVASLVVDAACMLGAALAPTVWVLGLAVFVMGVSGAVLAIARQSFLTAYVPYRFRARAMSTLGGVFRVGAFLGPLLGAAFVAGFGLRAAFWLAIGTSLLSAAVTLALPETPPEPAASGDDPVSMPGVLRAHAHTYLTSGLGAAALMLVRASRDSLLPLWSASIGLDAAQTSLIFAASSFADLTLFYVGGSLMDRLGRRAVAVPAMLIMGTCFGLLPLASSVVGVAVDAVALGFGNGISSGVVLTLGADAAPEVGRNHFLAGWRLATALGQAAGPLAVTALSAVASLSAAAVTIGVLGWAGAAWLAYWVRPAPRG